METLNQVQGDGSVIVLRHAELDSASDGGSLSNKIPDPEVLGSQGDEMFMDS